MRRLELPVVTHDDYGICPAGKPDECFYCRRKVGEQHTAECVIVEKLVKVRVTVEISLRVPYHWGDARTEFYYNEGTWCAGNLTDYIVAHQRRSDKDCLCEGFHLEVLKTLDGTPVKAEPLIDED